MNSISEEIESTSEEEVENSFTKIISALISFQSPCEIPGLTVDLNRDEWRVVEQLGIIGDKFNEIHGQDIEKLLCVFPVTYKTSDVLCKIFCGLFDSENFSWGRIITFIFFGVRLFCRSIGNYLTALKDLCIEIVNSLKALFARGAFTWIANHGGWDL
ncbi:unnamed protein product [Hymenolepis diminuta]|uniref:BCL domain-containing protein n=1 Tax=Hymenolepis diminuta TaxID=6216 RepID=A0A0R3SYU2_HYMDI|nr:unnamed protein product [Hymenolepis diminuta]